MYAQPPITSHNAYTTSCIALCYSYTEPQSRGHPQNRPLNAKVPKSLERSALPSVVNRVGRGLQPRLLFLQLKSDGLSRRFSLCFGCARQGCFRRLVAVWYHSSGIGRIVAHRARQALTVRLYSLCANNYFTRQCLHSLRMALERPQQKKAYFFAFSLWEGLR